MRITRRGFIKHSTLTLAAMAVTKDQRLAYGKTRGVKFKVGAPDWNLRQEARPDSVALAHKLGFDGVQISLGVGRDHLPLSDPATQAAFLAESKRASLPIASVCLNILHVNYLKNDLLGQRWVADAIPVAKALGVRVILLPFFGRGALKTAAEMDYVGDALREVAPTAEKAGVMLGLEDTISARDNVRIMERSRSRAVLTYYDVGNSTGNGFNILEEIRWLGRERICEVHLKDNPNYLGKGKIDFPAVIDALADIGFDGWAQLECDAPSGSVENDMRTNLGYIRGLIARRNAMK